MLGLIVATAIVRQGEPGKILDTIIPRADFDKVEIRTAIKRLFRKVHAPYRIIDPISGTVTLHLKNQKFELILQNVLNQGSGTYLYKHHRFEVIVRGDPPPQVIYEQAEVPAFDFRHTDIRDAINQLCASVGVRYSLTPRLTGSVNAKLPRGTFSKSLTTLLDQFACTYIFEKGLFAIDYKGPYKASSNQNEDSAGAVLNRKIPAVDFNNVDAREAVKELLEPYRTHYVLDGTVWGTVSLHLTNTTLSFVLTHLLRHGQGHIRYENEVVYLGYTNTIYIGSDERSVSQILNGGVDYGLSTYDFENTDLREALKVIFRRANLSYSIPPDITGNVTLHLAKVQFFEVLNLILQQVGATYRYEGGVYVIVRSTAIPSDGDFLAVRLPRVEFKDTDIHEALQKVFGYEMSYSIAPDVQGKVTLSMQHPTLREVLDSALRQVHASYWYDNETLKVIPEPKFPNEILDHVVPKFDAENLDIQDALNRLGRLINIKFILAPGLTGRVSGHFKDAPFELILLGLLTQVGASYRADRGTFRVIKWTRID